MTRQKKRVLIRAILVLVLAPLMIFSVKRFIETDFGKPCSRNLLDIFHNCPM